MIKRATVFIVGAGASAPYGFPLGDGLVKHVVAGVAEGGAMREELLAAGLREADLNEFREKIVGSDPDSLDTFLEGNKPEYQEIGRAAIALNILRAEKACRESGLLIGNAPRDDHWLGYVWNRMWGGVSEGHIRENRVTFVTFNYDRTIEYYFQSVFKSAFNLPTVGDAQALRKEVVQVIHLHGAIPEDRPFGAYNRPISGEGVQQLATGIRIVHDTPADKLFATASEVIRRANLVVLLGFGYHEVNIRRLNLKGSVNDAVVLAGTTHRMGEAEVRMAIGRLGLNLVHDSNRPGFKAWEFLREFVELY